MVRENVDAIIHILQKKHLTKEQIWSQIGRIVDARFDFRSMTQTVLATKWHSATRAEKHQFVDFFSQYVEDRYRSSLEAYTDQRVEYGPEQIKGNKALVETQILADGHRIPVNYKLRNDAGEWVVYDVVIKGISIVDNYRDTFDAILKAQGMGGLLNELEGRIHQYAEPPTE